MSSTNNMRRLAIGDIHGCGKTFEALLNKVDLQKNDSLYILGDMINRGKRTQKTIKIIIELQKEGYNVFPLRGNHEQFLISEMSKNNIKEFYVFCKRIRLDWLIKTEPILQLKKKYFNFFNSLPFYFDLGDRLLSHAGFDFTQNNYLDNQYAMLNQREPIGIQNIPDTIKIIHGHTPISLGKISRSIQSNSPIINIDNGCVYKSLSKNSGNLICLDLDSFQITIQKNID